MIKWDYLLWIGHERIDLQHRALFDLISEFADARLTNAPIYELHSILEEIVKYTEFHFVSEEHIMAKSNYPDLTQHKMEHKNLMSNLTSRLKDMAMGKLTPDLIENFLVDWFLFHIQRDDKKISDHIKHYIGVY